jgi:hypothetical protein
VAITQSEQASVAEFREFAAERRFRAHLIDVGADVSTTQNCRFGVGRSDSARLAAIMLLIEGGGAGEGAARGSSPGVRRACVRRRRAKPM